MKNFKIITALFVLMFLANISYSQVTAVLLPPPPFRFNASDLWKVTLINTGAPVNIYLKAIVRKSNMMLVEATSAPFVLPTTLTPKLISAASISPIDLKKYSSEVDDNFKSTGSLPSGRYNICIYVYASGTTTLLSEYCNDFEVLQTVRGELISPQDKDDIKTILPIFNWLPPVPVPPGSNVTYEINIVEILERQTAFYAMSANPYIYFRKNITTGLFQYPVSALSLENNRRYAWRVKTYLNGSLLSESEVREFTYNGKMLSSKDINEKNIKTYKEETTAFIKLSDKIKHKPTTSGIKGLSEHVKLNLNSPEFIDFNGIQSKSPIKLTGSYNATGKLTDRQKTGSQIPRNLLGIQFDPTVSFYGLPFTFSFYYDTQQQEFKQNINSFALFFDPTKLEGNSPEETKTGKSKEGSNGLLKFFSGFTTFGIGETYPAYSKYILSGTKVSGLDLEYQTGLLYLAVSGMNNLKAIDAVNFGRKLFAGKVGVGGKDDSHLHITFMKAKDDINSLDVNDATKVTSGMSPMENVIIGTEGKLRLFKDRVMITGEISSSVITDDLRAPDLISDDIPDFVHNLMSVKMGTHYDLMYNIESVVNIPESNTKVKGGYKFIGLGYNSLGAASFTNGVKGFNIGVEQYFVDKKINVKLSTERLRSEKTLMDKNRYDFALSMFLDKLPYLIVSYTPYSEFNDATADSLKIDNFASAFSMTTGINIPVNKYVLGSMVSLSRQTNQTKKGLGDYTIYNLLLNETVTFESPFSITAGVNIASISSSLTDSLAPANTYSYDLSGSMTLFEKWNNTLSFSYQRTAGLNSNTVLSFISSIPVYSIGNLSVSILKNFYRETIYAEGNNNDILFRATFSKSW